MRRQDRECGDKQSHPVEHRRNCQGAKSDNHLNNGKGEDSPGKTVSEPASEESSETNTRHISAEDDTNGVRAVAEYSYELATPNDLKKQRGKT
jgi:hypothetical protein